VKTTGHGRRSNAEWVTLALSVFVVGALVAVALVEEARRQQVDQSSVQVTFDREHTTTRESSYYVPYTIRNTGGNAISSAEIWIEVYDGELLVESAEILVQYLPLQGKQDGIYVSAHDPRTHGFRGRLESLQFP
jgi:uncharacterized protein (TIGR02588 family)